ncbi:hypothetical protein H0H93_012627 [Arthromyces matolae]|nr:hypothetical protein H0H93_012627 [Arthromyces matolae]
MAFWSSTKPNPPPITTTLTTPAPVLDVEISDPPSDSISSIQFSSQANILAVGSWDSSVRVYEIDGAGQSQGRAMLQHSAPVLSVCWNRDGKVFSGGADAAGKMLDVATGQSMQVAQHDATIKAVKWVETPGTGYLATGSWDKTIRYWDLRQSTPAATIQLPERCYTFDVQFPLMVVGTADRQVLIYDMNNLSTPYKTMESPLKWQTRVVTCLPTSGPAGYAIGSVEGRVAIRYVEEKDNDAKYPQCAQISPPGAVPSIDIILTGAPSVSNAIDVTLELQTRSSQ